NNERVVDQNARSLFQLRQRSARIDVAIIIRSAHDDVCGVFGNCTEKCADPIRRRSHFLDHFLELLDHLPRFADHLRLIGNVWPQIEKIATDGIAWWKRSDDAVESVEQWEIRRGLVETFELSAALFAHCKTPCTPKLATIITFSSNFRNLRRRAPTKCSTSDAMAQLRKKWMQRHVAESTVYVSRGALAQLVRAPPCHGGGCGFEPRRLRGFCIIL